MQVGPATIPGALAAVLAASTVAVAAPGDIVEDALAIVKAGRRHILTQRCVGRAVSEMRSYGNQGLYPDYPRQGSATALLAGFARSVRTDN